MQPHTQRGLIANAQLILTSLADMLASFARSGTLIGQTAEDRAEYFNKAQKAKGLFNFADQILLMEEQYGDTCPELVEQFKKQHQDVLHPNKQ